MWLSANLDPELVELIEIFEAEFDATVEVASLFEKSVAKVRAFRGGHKYGFVTVISESDHKIDTIVHLEEGLQWALTQDTISEMQEYHEYKKADECI